MIDGSAEQIAVPPPWKQALYRAGIKLPLEYKDWVERDIASPAWGVKDAVGNLVSGSAAIAIMYGLFQLSDSQAGGDPPLGLIAIAFVILTVPYLFPRYRARRARQSLNRHKWKWASENSSRPADGP